MNSPSSRGDKEEDPFDRNEILIGMVNSILNPTNAPKPSTMSVQDFKEQFRKEYKEEFDKVSGVSVPQFVDKNSQFFETVQDKKLRMMIKQRRRKNPKKKKRTKREDPHLEPISLTEDISEAEYMTAESGQCSEESSEESSPNEAYLESCKERLGKMLSDTSDSDDNAKTVKESDPMFSEWKQVCRNKSQVPPPSSENQSGLQRQFHRTMSEEEKRDLTSRLLQRKDSHDFILKQSVKEYLNHPCKLVLDLVSLWNTTARTTSYIVIRLDQNMNMALISDFLKLDNFTSLPQYQYFGVEIMKSLYGVFEIPSSHGAGQPVITKTEMRHSENQAACWERDQLWIRQTTSPSALSLSDPLLAMIYQWFAGVPDSLTKPKSGKVQDEKSAPSIPTPTENKDFITDKKRSSLEIFRIAVRGFVKGQYILLAGNMPKGMQNMEAISTVPWIYVFDFDFTSRDSGLLCVNENFIKKRRSLHLTNWLQTPAGISENGTSWTFLRGRRDNPESVFKNTNDLRDWLHRVKGNIDLHIEHIQRYIEDYTVITVIMFWPSDESLAQHMHKFLTRLDEGLDPKPKIILCIPGKPVTDIGNSILTVLKNEMGENLIIIDCDLKLVCGCIIDITKSHQIQAHVKYTLPTADDFSDPSIEDCDAAWLKEELEVLYLSNPYTKGKIDVKALEEEGDSFFRGGSLHWFAWYEVGAGHFDAQRDLMTAVMKAIKVFIDENRSGVVTLYHAPGSGGTTLAQRILWEFHTQIPCAHVKLRSTLPVANLVERIEMMYAKTHRPVLLLLDGDDEVKVKQLIRILKTNYRCYIIILYVKRYPYMQKKGNKLFLQGTVSKVEAKRLALKFKNQCKDDTKKQEQLSKFCEDVENGKQHLVYEFGLAAYLHEYIGIGKYVKGYLWPAKKSDTEAFSLGRKLLSYLSLAYYYGQTALPLQFFYALLHKPQNYLIEMDDLPQPVSQFVVFDKNECKSNSIRVCHYLIAKEILEQVLGNGSEERSTQLCLTARQNLAHFCEEFIEYASRKGVKSGNIVYLLTRIFIFRDNKDMGENAEQIRKKPVLSRLMLDISSKGPFFSERLNVLKKLTEAFPNDQNFHAHLGRFYAYCRPNEDDEAEKCLQKATEICERQIGNKTKEELDERLLHSLMHVYHIYGTVLQKRIARYTGQSPTDEPDIETTEEVFDERLQELIQLAKLSCEYFKKCRNFTPDGHESCYGFVGEITVRLQICDFIERNFKEHDESSGIKAYLSYSGDTYSTGRKFVKKSVYCIDNLLMECYYTLEGDDIDHSVQKVIFWYNHLFSKHAVDLEDLAEGDNIHAYRLQIAAKKLKYSCGETNLMMLEKIDREEDITAIVHLYENIFRETISVESKSVLDRDYTEWIFAIRHRLFNQVYSVETVLQHVRRWHDFLHSPMSKFYLFILTSLLGFGKNNTNGSSESLSEANILKKDMEKVSRYVLKPKYPREWLRKNGEGIKTLEPGIRFMGYVVLDDRNLREDIYETLRICKGTICAPNNKKLGGFISLDLGNNVVPVRVFYIPNKANLASTAHAEKRVEFILGFSLHHGWEAFNVFLLKKYPCPKPQCNAHIELTTADDNVKCPGCQKTVHRDEFTEVL
ncbi:uncharacterized protein LOC133187555 [Saccostrea echinata]|uniref:uncharacterized protein LOC133187555 n=1 Tax=Saccostrea echinata TaxID=191078 RepID=UPI002A818AB1|nr:uncharacterized protein LOC133187555 [Saccostrea echinata]